MFCDKGSSTVRHTEETTRMSTYHNIQDTFSQTFSSVTTPRDIDNNRNNYKTNNDSYSAFGNLLIGETFASARIRNSKFP